MPPAAYRAVPATYQAAGVDLEQKERLMHRLGPLIRATLGPATSPWGGFAGTIGLPADARTLAVTTDGVGTKTLLARRLGRDEVVGGDIVAHCANDLAVAGAVPLAFVDYIAMARLDEGVVTAVIRGIAAACGALGVPLLGGETAEMPDVYHDGAYDVAGTMIGVVRTPPDPARIFPHHRVIGLASTGLHTNGYALARRLVDGVDLDRHVGVLGTTLGDALMAPHRCYAAAILALCGEVAVDGVAHITGGGLPGNLPRVLPEGLALRLNATWPRPPIFRFLQRLGDIDEREMRRTFNLGVGMAVLAAPEAVPRALEVLAAMGEEAWDIGEVVEGAGEVMFG